MENAVLIRIPQSQISNKREFSTQFKIRRLDLNIGQMLQNVAFTEATTSDHSGPEATGSEISKACVGGL